MSAWSERIANHGVWNTLTDLAAVIESAASRLDLDADTLAGIERVRAVQELMSQRLSSIDPALLTVPVLDGIFNATGNATGELRAFVTDGVLAHVLNANANIDTALTSLSGVPTLTSGNEVKALGRAAADYRRSTEAALGEVQKVARTITDALQRSNERVEVIATDVTRIKERAETQASDFQAQFSAAQDARSVEHAGNQTSRQERFNAVLIENQEKAVKKLEELSALQVATKATLDQSLSELQASHATRATALLAEMETQKLAIEKLVGVIGNLGVTSGYQKVALAARSEKQLWQSITVVAFLGFIAFAWDAFLPVTGDSFSWPSFAGRALLTVAVGLFAAYAAKQGDKAAQLEAYNRAMALDLEAFGPFISPLPDAKQEEFREKMADRSFVTQRHIGDGQGERSPTGVVDLIRDRI